MKDLDQDLPPVTVVLSLYGQAETDNPACAASTPFRFAASNGDLRTLIRDCWLIS